MTNKFKRWTGIALAASLVAGLSIWTWYDSRVANGQLIKHEPPASSLVSGTPEFVSELPVRVMVPRLGIDAAIAQGVYDPELKTWNVSDMQAQFATITQLPNTQRGTTLIYAHNTRHLFGPLKEIEAGDEVQLRNEGGQIFEYVYDGKEVVDPTNTALFENINEGPPRLVLLTCSGGWNQKRSLHSFRLVRNIL